MRRSEINGMIKMATHIHLIMDQMLREEPSQRPEVYKFADELRAVVNEELEYLQRIMAKVALYQQGVI